MDDQPLGRLDGEYTVIGQVEQVVGEGDEWPVMRLTQDAPVTPLELTTMKNAIKEFAQGGEDLGLHASSVEATLTGPALVLTPIAIFR